MNKNFIVTAGIALVLALASGNLRAQDNPAGQPVAPPPIAPNPPSNLAQPGQPVAPSPVPRPAPLPPRFRQQPRIYVQRAVSDLRMVKMTLQNDQQDYGGRKESAIAACDKAMQELQEIMKSMPLPTPPPQRPGATFQQKLTPINPPPAGNPPPATTLPVAPPTNPNPVPQ
ncbi:MAG TPA: hypothetical protein VGO59_09835 [Verrucomicrobiae bacterium]